MNEKTRSKCLLRNDRHLKNKINKWITKLIDKYERNEQKI